MVVFCGTVRLKYVKRAETAARRVYHTQLGVARRAAGGWQIFRQIVGEVRKEEKKVWEILVRKNLEKVAHLIQKHRTDMGRIGSKMNTSTVSQEQMDILGHTEIVDSVVDEDMEIPVYGDVSLDEDEKNILRKPPKFATFGKVDLYTFYQEVQCQVEVAQEGARVRRGRGAGG